MKIEKNKKDQEDAVLLRIAKGELTVPNQPRPGSSIELPSWNGGMVWRNTVGAQRRLAYWFEK